MALHRDILWIGRQWAVTGHGMQLIDQRLEGAFDIEVARLWDDDLIESLRAKAWLKADDFEKGLEVARTRHSQPQAGSSPPVAPPPAAIEPAEIEPAAPSPPPKLEASAPVEPYQPPPIPPEAASPQRDPIEPPSDALPALQMKVDGSAKFTRPWRVWMKKKT
jgi:hypothetical protein